MSLSQEDLTQNRSMIESHEIFENFFSKRS